MKTPLTHSETRLLKRILDKARVIENELARGLPVPEAAFFEMKVMFGELAHSGNPDISRLQDSADHFMPDMSLRHFLNFLIPVERLLDRNIKDNDFLVTSKDDKTKPVEKRPLVFVLHNLRSAFNVGSLFRIAETLAASQIHLVGYTAGPESDGVQKTAMGTDELVPSERFESIDHSLAVLREQGYRLIALETAPASLSLYEGRLESKVAFVLGNERFGLDHHVLRLCDEVRHIPLMGQKNSLNVANALSAAAFEWHRQQLEG
ncbi:MAG: TrmH family RNA methyltransferase [Bdellovibrionaceae bacterium]|nr:TrmH family RNA methyltransferase [Pseudobdellovibrionaceae bacterium]